MIKDTVIFDIEASCEDRKINPHYNMETIEIGAVKVRQGKPVERFQTFIRPEYIDNLTDYCTELTGLTFDDLKNAPTFGKAILEFYDFIYGCNIYSSGDFDRKFLIRELEEKGFDREHELARNAIHASHTDLKKHYNKVTGKKKQGMPGMARELGIKLTGEKHRGLADSLNLTKIYLKLEKIREKNIRAEFNEKTMRKLVLNLNSHHNEIIHYENGMCIQETSEGTNEYTIVEFLDLWKDLILIDIEERGLVYLSPPKVLALKKYAK